MKPGDLIWVKVFKSDGRPYRWWQAQVEAVLDDSLVTVTGMGNPVYHNPLSFPHAVYRQKRPIRSFYWPGRRYDVLEVYQPDGQLYELYADITSPVEIANNEIRFIDHELDVSLMAGLAPRIVDQEEFAEAAIRFGYTAEFVRESYELAERLLGVLSAWTPRGMDGVQG